MSTRPRARNARGTGARLRDEILDAAIRLLDETDDPAAVTLRGVARRAGISAPSIYAHFDNLAALVEALLAHCFDQLRSDVADAVGAQPDDDPAAALVAAGSAYVRFAWEHRARYRLMFDADGYAANAIDTFGLVESLVDECARTGVGQSSDPRLDTWMVWAALHGVATLEKPARPDYRRLGTLDRPAMLKTMICRLARIDSVE